VATPLSAPFVLLISIDGFADFYWRDERVKAPTLRALAEDGAVADGVRAVFPSTTWPTHVSLVTGVTPARHGVVANHVLNRATRRAEDLTGDPIYDADALLKAPTVYDRAAAAGLKVAAVDWPATRRSASLAFNLPFFKDQRVFETQTTPAVWAELEAAGFPVDRQGEWALLPKRFMKDTMVADVAAHAVHRHAPDMLMVHFLCADSHQHLYGPRAPEVFWAIEHVDGCIRRLLDALPDRVRDRAAVVVVSDHGFLPVERDIRPNVRLRRLGALRGDGASGFSGEACFVMNHGAGYLYALDGDAAAVRSLTAELAKMDGVAATWPRERFAELGLPADHAMLPDAVFEAKPGYQFSDETAGEDENGAPKYRGTHGQRPDAPGNAAFFMASGAGIRRGAKLGRIESRDVAPTLATLLGVPMPDVEGRVLTEIADV
jgi:predicted AlkP superfamily pyrophosphatase or phosphodiesterase